MKIVISLVAALALLVPIAPAAGAPVCEPYCNDTTTRIANRLNGHGHGAWLATVLDQYGYHGRRHAEITRIPAGHGKRFVGVIQVPDGNARKARRALLGWWFAQKRTMFVLPLVTKYDTQGGTGVRFRQASKWAVRRLGAGWVVVKP
jgi:hypothetical protein